MTSILGSHGHFRHAAVFEHHAAKVRMSLNIPAWKIGFIDKQEVEGPLQRADEAFRRHAQRSSAAAAGADRAPRSLKITFLICSLLTVMLNLALFGDRLIRSPQMPFG